MESWYLLSTEAGPSTEQMHENRPTSVSEGQNTEAESSSSQDSHRQLRLSKCKVKCRRELRFFDN